MPKEALFGRAKMIEELGPHLIADQRYRLPFEQTVSRCLQYVAQIVLRYTLSDHFVERLTAPQRGLYGLLERIIDEPLAAQAQKAAVPDLMIGSPTQNSDCRFVWHQQPQSLACPVPI